MVSVGYCFHRVKCEHDKFTGTVVSDFRFGNNIDYASILLWRVVMIVSTCLFVCLSVHKYTCIFGTTRHVLAIFFCVFVTAVDRSSRLAITSCTCSLWMTSYLHIMDHTEEASRSILLPRVTASLRRCVQANTAAASYWLCPVLDNGGRRN